MNTEDSIKHSKTRVSVINLLLIGCIWIHINKLNLIEKQNLNKGMYIEGIKHNKGTIN